MIVLERINRFITMQTVHNNVQLVHVQRDFIRYFFAVSRNLKKGILSFEGGAFRIWQPSIPINGI